jgi:hypothetical protein
MNTKVVPNPEQKGWEPDGTTTDGTPIYKWESGGGSGGSLWTDNGDGSISYDGTVKVNGKNGKGLHFDLSGSSDYVIQESTSSDIIRFGAGGVTDFTHNISSGNVTVTGDLLAAKADAGTAAVAIGALAGKTGQGRWASAVGYNSGATNQGEGATAVGIQSGYETQGEGSTAVGQYAGSYRQNTNAVAVGYRAGMNDQGQYATAVGQGAGKTDQGDYSTAVGVNAGETNQGSASVAIGWAAGQTNQAANGIIINSSGSAQNTTSPNHIFLISGTNKFLYYNGQDKWEFAGGTVTGGGLRFDSIVQDGAPVIDAKGLISTLSTLRNATKDETTLDGLRDALSDAIGGLIEKLEHEIGTQEIPE